MSSTISGFVAPPTKPLPANIEQLRSQAKELEGVFLNTLMKQMFSGIKTDQSSFGGGFAEETWRGMQSEQLSNQIAENGGLGIADSLIGDLIAMQEAAQTSPTAFYKGVTP
jgi:peptidoglycan hydrolase FlgJ